MDPKQKFYNHFLSSQRDISERIALIPSISTVAGERQEATDHILAAISRLQNEVADSADFTPAYDRKQYSDGIDKLKGELNAVTREAQPRGRFTFKKRTHVDMGQVENDPRLNPGSQPLRSGPKEPEKEDDVITDLPVQPGKNYNLEMSQPSSTSIRKPSFSTARNIGIDGQTGLHILLPHTAAQATAAGSLTNLKKCIVDMSAPTGGAPFPSLAMRGIDDSLIVAGRVAGPCHITSIRRSTLVVSARQVRIHECEDVDVYLWCGSHPIIEDCKGMRFAPLPACYMTETEKAADNQWDKVDDFKWLKASESPNWAVMPEADRLPEDVWTEVVPGRPGASVEETLATVGLPGQK